MAVRQPNLRIVVAEELFDWAAVKEATASLVLAQLPRRMILKAAGLNICLLALYIDLG